MKIRSNRTPLLRLAVWACLLPCAAMSEDRPTVHVEVDAARTTRRLAANPVGFCLSYLNDQDTPRRKSPLASVVSSMQLGSLRYPMGTLAENYLFHDLRLGPPQPGKLKPRVISTQRRPAQWTYAMNPDGSHTSAILDFDEFVDLCRESGTEPVVLVSSHGHLFPGSEFDAEDIARNAEQWVRYANVTRKLGIKYWEIGNEVDLKHPRELMSQAEYMQIYGAMAARMKAVDPSIRTGLGTCNGAGYARDALTRFPELVDFIVVHQYAGSLKTHAQYVNYSGALHRKLSRTLAVIDQTAPQSRRRSTEVLVTEFSSFCAGAKEVPPARKKNSILSAMITFEMLMEGVDLDERVRFLHFWVTHSPWGKSDTDYANALAPDNALLPQGRALEIAARFIQDRMVAVEAPGGPLRCWASASSDGSKIAVWLLNRSSEPARASLKLSGTRGPRALSRWVMAGQAPGDENPYWGRGEDVAQKDGIFAAILPPLSITVLHR